MIFELTASKSRNNFRGNKGILEISPNSMDVNGVTCTILPFFLLLLTNHREL